MIFHHPLERFKKYCGLPERDLSRLGSGEKNSSRLRDEGPLGLSEWGRANPFLGFGEALAKAQVQRTL